MGEIGRLVNAIRSKFNYLETSQTAHICLYSIKQFYEFTFKVDNQLIDANLANTMYRQGYGHRYAIKKNRIVTYFYLK